MGVCGSGHPQKFRQGGPEGLCPCEVPSNPSIKQILYLYCMVDRDENMATFEAQSGIWM